MKEAIKLRTVFMGTSNFAKTILHAMIAENYNIVGVFTSPDAAKGRKMQMTKSPVKEHAESHKLPVFEPHKFDAGAIDKLKKLKPDLVVVAAYGKILPPSALEIPGFGCLNVHGSLLPKYRGPSPVQNALLNGEKVTGVTMILMDENVDTGKIIASEKIEIDIYDNAKTLMEKLAQAGARLLVQTIPPWIERKIEPVAQDNSGATLCQLIEREDGRIIWEDDAMNIYNKYRAFYEWPGIFCYLEKEDGSFERLKIIKAGVMTNDPQTRHEIGEVFQIGDKIAVQAGKGLIIIEEIQTEGKNAMPIQDFLNGNPGFLGSLLR